MSAVEKNWQTTRPTIRERSKYMFNNDLFSDVKFVVPKAVGESESKQVIPAHKFVLSISSPVFEAMFYGELAETRDSIELPECEYDSVFELFRYMYSDEVNLSGSNVMGVLYLANKYMAPSLAEKCSEYLQDNLDPSNVFSILPEAQKYEEKNLVERCWEVIDDQTEAAVKSEEFATIQRSLLETLVERDTLNIDEIDLFKAMDLWATKKCEEEGLTTDGSEKRKILGERIVKGIRFPVMEQYEFAAVVLDCKILTPDEIVNVVKIFNAVPETPVQFSEEARTGLCERCQRCCRFRSVDKSDSGYRYLPDKKDCLIFTVDKDISLFGVTLYGSTNNKYSVTIKVKQLGSDYLYSKSGNFSTVRIKSDPFAFYGFNILFDRPLVLRKGSTMEYRIEACISGANSCFGQNGQNSVVSSGVNFFFKDSSESSNGTTVKRGQFAALLFKLL